MHLDLVPVWTVILGVGVFMYVLLDGFDLGVGILFPFARDDASRTLMMNSVAPVWDGNETWLMLGGTGLLSAFPLAFSVIIPAMYFPILLMLLGLIFRGVAFEFRLKANSGRHWWDRSFFCGLRRRHVFPGRRARRIRAGLRRVRPAFRGRQFRLGHAVSARHRRGPAVRLRAARCHMARDEDGRRPAGEDARRKRRRACSACSPSSRW